MDDSWRWSLAPNNGYTVGSVYHMLMVQESIAQIVNNDTIWNKSVLLKLSFFLGGYSEIRFIGSLVQRGLI